MNIVIAENKVQYHAWILKHFVRTRDYVYIESVKQLQELELTPETTKVYFVGRYKLSPVFNTEELNRLLTKNSEV